ncbi:MAG: peptidylprolyl isomerase [Pseudomonadota bacterium]
MKPNLLCIPLLFLLSVLPMPTAAQPYEPAIFVNEKVITGYEITQRALLLRALGAGGDTTELARTQLIDDRLRLAVIERFEQELSSEEIDAAVADFAARRNLELAQVFAALDERGVAEKTLRDFVSVAIAWRNLVQGRFRRQAAVSEQDLDLALDFANRPVQESVLLQEIAISTEEFGEVEATELARDLSRRLNRGGNFTSAVQRYSRAPSAPNSGRLNWLPTSELPGIVSTQVVALQPGEVSAPIPLGRGISLFKLLGIREEPRSVAAVAEDTVTYYQLIQPLPTNAAPNAVSAALTRAQAVQSDTQLCRDLDDQVSEFGASSGRSEPSRLGSVPGAIAERLREMETGDIQVFQDDRGVVLLMLCARAGETSPEEREALRRQLFSQRMASFAEGFLQDLRGDAVIVER